MIPVFNWKEIQTIVGLLKPHLEGATVDRVIVAERPKFAGGFLKSEWTLRLRHRRGGSRLAYGSEESIFVFSVRSMRPYLYWTPGKGPKASEQGTRSGFDLQLGKTLRGRRIESVEATPNERIVTLWFEAERGRQFGLILFLIAAAPEAFLVERKAEGSKEPAVLARSRKKSEEGQTFQPPRSNQAPKAPEVREAYFQDGLKSLARGIETGLLDEAFEARRKSIEQSLRAKVKAQRQALRLHETAVSKARSEPDWERFGRLLKASLHLKPKGEKGFYAVEDYETGERVEIPADPKRSAQAQVERFYSLQKRKTKRFAEATLRIKAASDDLEKLEAWLERAQSSVRAEPKELERLERELGLGAKPGPRLKRAPKKWAGRQFESKDGYAILVGRTKLENQELTFKIAKGNDIWLHVRGKPGAHGVILLPSGKSAPLETLLDAAVLTLYFSDGEHWGKTEVDYTPRKYVKRIKGSLEVSYSQNKTLLVKADRDRLDRLLGKSG